MQTNRRQGDQPGRHPEQLVVRQLSRVDRRWAEPALLVHADELEVRTAASGRGCGEHLLDEGSRWLAGEVEPAEQLELLGAGQEPAEVRAVGRGPVGPGRRTALAQVRDPAPGPGPAEVHGGAHRRRWRASRVA